MENNNTGYRNSGYRNSGDRNSGNGNSGNGNSGNGNSGYGNSGNWNSGNWNSGNGYQNHFCTQEQYFLFDKPCTKEEANKVSELCIWRYFYLTKWIVENDMTSQEKEEHPFYKTTKGYLKTYSYKEAWRNAWDKMSQEEKDQIKNLKNFDREKFKEISGIEIDDLVEIRVEGNVKRISRLSAKELGLI